MWIRSQNQKHFLNITKNISLKKTEYVDGIAIKNKYRIICNDIPFAEYSTEKKAMKVLDNIGEVLNSSSKSKGVFQLPQENEV